MTRPYRKAKTDTSASDSWLGSVAGWFCLGLILGTYVVPASIGRARALGQKVFKKGK